MLHLKKRRKPQKTIYETLKENFKYSLSISSISGVSHVSCEDGRTKPERLFWILAIVLMAGMAVVQGLNVYARYTERPVIITVDKSFFEWKLTFPSATVCARDLRITKELTTVIRDLVTKFNLSGEILTSENEQFLGYLRDLAFKDYNTYEDYKVYATEGKKEYLSPDQYMEVLDQVVWKLKLPTGGAEIISNSPVNMPLGEIRPVYRIFTEYGPCSIINPDIGIYLTPGYYNLSTPYHDYEAIYFTKNVMASMTVKIAIENDTDIYFHAPNEVMDITDTRSRLEGFYVKNLKYENVVVTVQQDRVNSLSVQQKNCRLPYEPNEQPLEHSPVYSHNLCSFECRIRLALKYCNCTPYYYRRLNGEPICNMTGMYCLSSYKDMLLFPKTTETDVCGPCLQNCELSLFRESEVTQNTKFWLGPGTFGMFIIFPKKIYTRNLIFHLLDLIVQIGGIFSLFLGCSLLSFVEIGYFLTLRIFFAIRGHVKEKNRGY